MKARCQEQEEVTPHLEPRWGGLGQGRLQGDRVPKDPLPTLPLKQAHGDFHRF